MNISAPWEIVLAGSARKALEDVPSRDRERIEVALRGMATDPFQGDVKLLQGKQRRFRRRVGSWRIFFSRIGNERRILIAGGVMSKVTVALASFIVGACTTLFGVGGIHTSTLAQSAPQSAPATRGFSFPGGEPVVPGLKVHVTKFGINGNMLQSIDGLDCDQCSFSNATIEYAGGAFKLTNFSFSGPIRVNLKGAAANTLVFVQFIQQLAASQQPKLAVPKTPIPQIVTFQRQMMGDFMTPY